MNRNEIREFQMELCGNLYAELQIAPECFSSWEQKFVDSCYSLLKQHEGNWALTQTQQEKLEEIYENSQKITD
jgi:hypothetical protein